MRITIVQSPLHWESPEMNRQMFAQKISTLRGLTDLVMLPEMFTTGFSMNATLLAEPVNGPTLAWMRELSNTLNAAITGSFICSAGEQYFNRLLFVRPDGSFDHYDKKHLFALTGEHHHYVAGKDRITVLWQGWRICPLICYDLRFPAWARNVTKADAPYDLLLFVANWPARRAHHWRTLLAARAIENQSFVAGVNIAGTDGNGFEYTGDSAIIDYSGQALAQIPEGKADMITVELSLEDLQAYRQQLPFLKDADRFEFVV